MFRESRLEVTCSSMLRLLTLCYYCNRGRAVCAIQHLTITISVTTANRKIKITQWNTSSLSHLKYTLSQ
jgi:hypothetical protein